MAKIKIGKVVPTYAGEWKANTEYLSQTVVVYGGSSFISIRDLVGSLRGVAPINDGVNWRLIASKGAKGDRGTDGTVSFAALTPSQKSELKGERGEAGYYYIPVLDDEGNLSWSNNGGLENPAPVNLRGPQGLRGNPGGTFSLRIGRNEQGEEGHLIMEVLDDSYANLLYLGEDGHLYVNTQ